MWEGNAQKNGRIAEARNRCEYVQCVVYDIPLRVITLQVYIILAGEPKKSGDQKNSDDDDEDRPRIERPQLLVAAHRYARDVSSHILKTIYPVCVRPAIHVIQARLQCLYVISLKRWLSREGSLLGEKELIFSSPVCPIPHIRAW